MGLNVLCAVPLWEWSVQCYCNSRDNKYKRNDSLTTNIYRYTIHNNKHDLSFSFIIGTLVLLTRNK